MCGVILGYCRGYGRMRSSVRMINHSFPLGLDGSECLWCLDDQDFNGTLNLEEGPSTDNTAAQSKWTTLRSMNYGLPGLVVVSLVLAFFVVVTAFGNCLVIVALFRYRSLRTVSNFLIGNLALSDFLLAVTILPLSSVNECLGHWVFGRLACNLWLTLDVLYCTASIWNLCMIAFDRFTATLYPLWYHEKRSTKQAAVYILLIWVISGAICVPPALGWGELSQNYFLNNSTNVFECVLFQSPGYVLYSASGSFYIPFLITFFLYVRIFSLLRRRMRRMRSGCKPRASSCLNCCSGRHRIQSSPKGNGYPRCRQSGLGSATPRMHQYLDPRVETRTCLDVSRTDTAADASTNRAHSSCPSHMGMAHRFSSWHRKSMTRRRPGAGDNIRMNSHNPLSASSGSLPVSLVPNGTRTGVENTSRMIQEQNENPTERNLEKSGTSVEGVPTGIGLGSDKWEADSDETDTFEEDVRRSCESLCLKSSAPEQAKPHLPASIRHSCPERTPVTPVLLPATSTVRDYSSPGRSWDSAYFAVATRHQRGENEVKGGAVGVARKEGGAMGVAMNGGGRAICPAYEGLNTSGVRNGVVEACLRTSKDADMGNARDGSRKELDCVKNKGWNLGGVGNEGGQACCIMGEGLDGGLATVRARSASADISFAKKDWNLSDVDRRSLDGAKAVGVAMGVARVDVKAAGGGTGAGAGSGLCRRKRRRRHDQRETNATIKMAIIIAFFCGMWIGFFVLYVVRGWCPVGCQVPRQLETFFFWLGYTNSSMNPVLYTLFNDDFRKAFQKLLGCYAKKNGNRMSRY